MTPRQIQCVIQSWQLVENDPVEFGQVFYTQLFALAPAMRRLFPSNLDRQHTMLARAMNLVVAGLSSLDLLTPGLIDLGRRHATYGAKPEDYAVFGKALIATLEERSNGHLTPEMREAWEDTFRLVSSIMLNGVETIT